MAEAAPEINAYAEDRPYSRSASRQRTKFVLANCGDQAANVVKQLGGYGNAFVIPLERQHDALPDRKYWQFLRLVKLKGAVAGYDLPCIQRL
jgi:hypothetical protein